MLVVSKVYEHKITSEFIGLYMTKEIKFWLLLQLSLLAHVRLAFASAWPSFLGAEGGRTRDPGSFRDIAFDCVQSRPAGPAGGAA